MNSNPNIDEEPQASQDPEIQDQEKNNYCDNDISGSHDNNDSIDDEDVDEYDEDPLVDSRNEYEDEEELINRDKEAYKINIKEEPLTELSLDPSEIDLVAYSNILFKLINKRRKAANKDELFENIGLKKLASEYSNLTQNGNSADIIQKLVSKYDYRGKYEQILIAYEYSHDDEFTTRQFDTWLADCLNLLFELEEDHPKLFDAALNSMGVGLALDNGCIYMSVFIGYVPIHIESIRMNAMNRLEIIGRVLEEDKGLYAIKLVNVADSSMFELVTFQNIMFDLSTLRYVIETDVIQEIEKPHRLIEFYLKTDPESIKYGYKTKIKYLSKAYEVNMKVPLEAFPTHAITQSRLITKSLNNSNVFDPVQKVNAMRKTFSIQQNELGRSASDLYSEAEDRQPSKIETSQLNPAELIEEMRRSSARIPDDHAENSISEFYFENNSLDDKKDMDLYNDANLRVELETAIHQALQELKKQISVNRNLQSKLVSRWNKTGIKIYTTEDNNDGINEIKYHNALALIHQIRKELETVKSKYDKVADELNSKLEEKVANCEKIRKAFSNLKQEISLKACYETSMKKIPQKVLDELETEETAVNSTYQQLRLDVIKTRIGIDKNQRGLKDHEQLAEGLHLIDFEKLKIENQSLNEKLEERNEEIFKLQKKNSVNLQILSHLKQKLVFEQREVEELMNSYQDKSKLTRFEIPTAKT